MFEDKSLVYLTVVLLALVSLSSYACGPTESSQSEGDSTVAPPSTSGSLDTEESPAEGIPDSEISPDRAIVREAVENYYLSLGAGDWFSTYETLDSRAQSELSQDEWELVNEEIIGSDGIPTYHIESIGDIKTSRGGTDMVIVSLSITYPDGEVIRTANLFVRSEELWQLFLTPEMIEAYKDSIEAYKGSSAGEEPSEPEVPESTDSELTMPYSKPL